MELVSATLGHKSYLLLDQWIMLFTSLHRELSLASAVQFGLSPIFPRSQHPSTQTGKVDFIRVSSFSHHAQFGMWGNTTLPTLRTMGRGTLDSMCLSKSSSQSPALQHFTRILLCLRFTVLSSSCPACWSGLPPPS